MFDSKILVLGIGVVFRSHEWLASGLVGRCQCGGASVTVCAYILTFLRTKHRKEPIFNLVLN